MSLSPWANYYSSPCKTFLIFRYSSRLIFPARNSRSRLRICVSAVDVGLSAVHCDEVPVVVAGAAGRGWETGTNIVCAGGGGGGDTDTVGITDAALWTLAGCCPEARGASVT